MLNQRLATQNPPYNTFLDVSIAFGDITGDPANLIDLGTDITFTDWAIRNTTDVDIYLIFALNSVNVGKNKLRLLAGTTMAGSNSLLNGQVQIEAVSTLPSSGEVTVVFA